MKSFVRFLIAIHYDLYQTALALITAIVFLHEIFDYNWPHAMAAATVTVVSYWAGQGAVAAYQRVQVRKAGGGAD